MSDKPQQKCVLDPIWSFYEERFFDSAHLSIHPLFWTSRSKCSWYYRTDVEKWRYVKLYGFKSVEFLFDSSELFPTFLLTASINFRHPISDEVISHRIFKASCCSTPTPFVKTKLDERKPSSDNFPQLSPGEDVTSTCWCVEEWCWMFPNRGFIFCATVSTLYSASRIMYSVHIVGILKSSS